LKNYTLSDFDYALPEELIAKTPATQRDQSRLLIVDDNHFHDTTFNNFINYINPNDLVVFNNSKVLKARLFGNKISGGKIELLVERVLDNTHFIAHIRSNKTINIGLEIVLPDELIVKVVEKLEGLFKLQIDSNIDFLRYLDKFGNVPLPPYIDRSADTLDDERYQTVYANPAGSVAAPTAGLHFTSELLDKIIEVGAKIAYVTLHIGSGTFKPVAVDDISQHKMHSELYSINQTTINLIKQTQALNGKIIAVGTTSLRTLETIANNGLNPGNGETDIFITPGYKFKLVDKLLTNFHLPKSTLLMLVSAFTGMDKIKNAYAHAISQKYRFFSYGDAMLLQRNKE
jgi:S-adenosylmethionine:tRNA ribosyltransferase-isomerase